MLRDDRWERIDQLLPGKATDGLPRRTTDSSSRPCYGLCVQGARGETYRKNSATGTGFLGSWRHPSVSRMPSGLRLPVPFGHRSSVTSNVNRAG